MEENELALRYFAQSFLEMGKRLREVQQQMTQVFQIIQTKFGDEETPSLDALAFWVNGCVWFSAVSDISQNLATMATSMSKQCNVQSGYKIDITGDQHDLFQQQRAWNARHGRNSGKTGSGDTEWN